MTSTKDLEVPSGRVSRSDEHSTVAALLEALRYARAALDSYKTTGVGIHYEAIRRADAAIAKAQGA